MPTEMLGTAAGDRSLPAKDGIHRACIDTSVIEV